MNEQQERLNKALENYGENDSKSVRKVTNYKSIYPKHTILRLTIIQFKQLQLVQQQQNQTAQRQLSPQ